MSPLTKLLYDAYIRLRAKYVITLRALRVAEHKVAALDKYIRENMK